MKPSKLLTLTGLALSVLLFSCKKDNKPAPPPVTPPDTVHTLHLNLTFLRALINIQYDSLKKYELIITTGGQKVLLDTITTFNTPVIADITSNQQLVDVSVIHNSSINPTTSYWTVNTYKAVDPTLWVTLPLSDSFPRTPNPTSSQIGSVTYLNSPVSMSDQLWFSANSANASGGYTDGNPTQKYTYINNKYAY